MNGDLRADLPRFSDYEYQQFSEFLKSVCGIYLGENKQYLVSTRIRRILVEHNLANLAALTERVKLDSERLLRQQVIDAMTTNETFWFRDTYPFEYLSKKLIPDFSKDNSNRKLKIWCAACSSGQEPYSISMIFEENLRNRFANRFCDAEILATDLSSTILESAKQAEYDRISLARGLSQERAKEFFRQIDPETWVVENKIRDRVRFRPLNLQESFYLLGKFDIVFCRNVLIYFSGDLKQEILKKIHGVLNPGGILFLGSSESIPGLSDHYEMIHCSPGVAYRAKDLAR